jgi:hypothetical protein
MSIEIVFIEIMSIEFIGRFTSKTVASLRDLFHVVPLTRHFRAGLSHDVPSGLEP